MTETVARAARPTQEPATSSPGRAATETADQDEGDILVLDIPARLVAESWVFVENEIAAACATSRGKYRPDDVKALLIEGRMQLWIVAEGYEAKAPLGVFVTEIHAYPQMKVCVMLVGVGRDRERWQHLISEVEDWARGKGCESMELIARPGWARIHKRHGYETTHFVLEKSLREEAPLKESGDG